jgi:acetoin utilization deacetylase AcuC-like enzyme
VLCFAANVPTGLCIDARFAAHAPPANHPERPQRLDAIRRGLEGSGLLSRITALAPRPATLDEVARAHRDEFITTLEATVRGHAGWIDPDTYYAVGSWDAALLAAGSTIDLALAVANGTLDNGFAFVRPPGHHATRDQAMGFCLLNNVAIAAARLRADGARVAILDWDVHHGNGTEDIFVEEPDVLYASLHEWPQYPGTGAPDFTGRGRGTGSTVNVALSAGTGDAEYLAAYRAQVAPALERFRPDVILVSAGFDAHRDDPLGGLELTPSTFVAMTRHLMSITPKVACVLEGGYDLDAIATSSLRVLETLLGVGA